MHRLKKHILHEKSFIENRTVNKTPESHKVAMSPLQAGQCSVITKSAN